MEFAGTSSPKIFEARRLPARLPLHRAQTSSDGPPLDAAALARRIMGWLSRPTMSGEAVIVPTYERTYNLSLKYV